MEEITQCTESLYEFIKDDPNSAMLLAARVGSCSLLKASFFHGARTVDVAIKIAAERGQASTVEICRTVCKASNLSTEYAGYIASCYGHIAIVRLCHEKFRLTDENLILAYAAAGNRPDVMKLATEKYGATDTARAFSQAVTWGNVEIAARISAGEFGKISKDEKEKAFACIYDPQFPKTKRDAMLALFKEM